MAAYLRQAMSSAWI